MIRIDQASFNKINIQTLEMFERYNSNRILVSDIRDHLKDDKRWKGITSNDMCIDHLDCYCDGLKDVLAKMGFNITSERHGSGIKYYANL